MFPQTRKIASLFGAALLVTGAASVAFGATAGFRWVPTAETVSVGDAVGLELWAFPSETVAFNSAQAVLQWDPAYLELTGVANPAYPPPPATSIWSSSFPFGDSFGLNETAPLPVDGSGLWVGEVAIGQTLAAGAGGLLLTTVLFEARAETPGTSVDILAALQLPGHPVARSKFIVGTSNILNDVGTPAVITIVPEPAGVLIGLAGVLFAARRR